MKKISLLTLALPLLFSACKKDSSTSKTDFTVFAKKNNVAWAAEIPTSTSMGAQSKRVISITARTGEETLNITFNNRGVGKYQSTDLFAYYYSTIGGDMVVSGYNLSKDASNEINVTSFDEAKNIMTGNFNLTLDKTYDGSNTLPNKLVFINGAFKSQINYAVL
jgi:hypothetical protein